MNLELYSIFLVTTVMLIFVPGPAAITVAAQGASHSSNKAFLGVLGVASADVAFSFFLQQVLLHLFSHLTCCSP